MSRAKKRRGRTLVPCVRCVWGLPGTLPPPCALSLLLGPCGAAVRALRAVRENRTLRSGFIGPYRAILSDRAQAERTVGTCLQLRDGNFLMPIWTRAKPTSAPCYPEISPFSRFRNQRFLSDFGFALCCVCPRNVHFRPCKPLLKAHRFRICAERTKPNSQQANSAAPSRYFSFSVGAALPCPHPAIPT